MKELSIEEKAKAYDEAVEIVRQLMSRCTDNRDRKTKIYRVEDIESIFPELKESEGEKIRKALCKMVNETANDDLWTYYDIHKEEALTWLEKQGKQQKVSWSEEDEKILNVIINDIQERYPKTMWGINCGSTVAVSTKYVIDWFNSLKDKVQPKQEWSEDDERTLNDIIGIIRPFGECPDYPTDEDREYYYGRSKMIDWLKSLKTRINISTNKIE